MSFLSRAFEKLFLSPEEVQLKRVFQQAAQAIRSNDTQTLKTVLGQAKLDQAKNQSLLVDAIAVDNLEGFEAVLDASGINVSENLSLENHDTPLVVQSLSTPMLPYAISRGSERISCFLARHPDTQLESRACMTIFNSCVCPSTGSVYTHPTKIHLRDAQSLAEKNRMTAVTEIIEARLKLASLALE